MAIVREMGLELKARVDLVIVKVRGKIEMVRTCEKKMFRCPVNLPIIV